MDYEGAFKIIKKTDDILDNNPFIRKATSKVLEILIKKTGAKGGTILIHDIFDNKLKILAKKGIFKKDLARESYSRKKGLIKKRELAIPLIIQDKRVGLIYLYGKVFDKNDFDYVSASEVILDGKFKHESESVSLRNIFERYVGEKTMKKILKDSDKDKLTGEKQNCTILFADVNNFTSFSNKRGPKEVVKFLNEFFGEMSKIVLKRDGTIDKYIGDAIMVIFGSPVFQKDHAARAISTAQDMIRKTREIIKKYNVPEGGLSVGIATGKVVAGNIGSKKMMDYTVIGRKVNLSSRLTSLAGRNQIMVDYTTKKDAKKFKYRKLGKTKLKGFKDIEVFKVNLS